MPDSHQKPYRILQLANDPDYFLSHRLPLAEAAAEFGYDYHVAIPFDEEDGRFADFPFELHRLNLSRASRNVLRELTAIHSINSVIGKVKPDLVHFITMKPAIYGGPIARLRRVPSINSFTGLGYIWISGEKRSRAREFLLNTILRAACRSPLTTNVFQNPDDRDEFTGRNICDADSTFLIGGSGVDTSMYRPRPPARGKPIVMLASRMLWDKGVGEFVEAARILAKRGVDARFVLVGGADPNPSSIPKAQLEEWVAEGAVEWWGWRDNMVETVGEAHIACLPSYREGLPKSLLEAAASGLPLIAADVPGCREIVRHEQNGLLVRPKDPIDLADAIEVLCGDAEQREAYGRRSREIVESDYSLTSVVSQTLDLYGEKLARI